MNTREVDNFFLLLLFLLILMILGYTAFNFDLLTQEELDDNVELVILISNITLQSK